MSNRDDEREVIYVERGDGASLKPILFGLAFGAALGLLFAPQSGEETRRSINRRMRRLRALAEEKVDELSERISPGSGNSTSLLDDDWESPRAATAGSRETAPRGHATSAREELERRLADARARRRSPTPPADDEEPLA
ncbi:MAG: YtxH domain-containing protein [Gemmatimonadota bacterium]